MYLLLALLLLLNGCAHVAGYAGENPARVECKGKLVISGQGQIGLSVGAGGNAFTLTADCGDGAFYQQGPALPAAPLPRVKE